MNSSDYRLERLTASLLSRQATLKRLLAPFNQNHGFAYLLRGAERQRVEDELQSVQALLAAAMPTE